MRKSLLLLLLFVSNHFLSAQDNDTWIAYWNRDTTLVGFKDKFGNIKIQPKFSGLTAPAYFDEIMAVTEEKSGTFEHYYLNKSGKKVGLDSLYLFDNTADCESEGFIRFRDNTADRVGMFNKNGDVVIPAEYNELSQVKNGMVVALKNAQKEIMGEHYSYKGGRIFLIDTNNTVIVDPFVNDNQINFYSMETGQKANPSPIRQNFKTKDGRYISFIDYEKEFRSWLKSSFLANLSKENLLNFSHVELSYWHEVKGWLTVSSAQFMERNYLLIKKILLQVKQEQVDYEVYDDGLNPYIFTSTAYKEYFNQCGESKDWIFPLKVILINQPALAEPVQDHFEFLRTDNGYKLISVTVRSGNLH